ncbi:MAG: glycosyltransferase family 2 protein [Paracoccus sp. (in: a-proteobacteria)]|uniref:glycosyltransferase family 2 protein n=1 Tax=Paracoccus sp. TaxID=267 RepID=UPI00391AE96C
MTDLLRQVWWAYRLRWKRRRLLWRCWRAARRLRPIADRTAAITPDAILAVVTIRNEALRLPEFLAHYRGLGVDHFLIVDNDSDDGSTEYLAAQPDVSLWHCGDSYRAARFGIDWAGALLWRYGHRHWCLTVDADELLIYPGHDGRDLHALTAYLDAQGVAGLGALMLDLYPQGPLGTADAPEGAALTDRLPWFDAGPHRSRRMMPRRNLWVQGGVRDRAFFADRPQRAPTLNKLPLIRWRRGYAYFNSTHSMLPPRLNLLWDGPGDPRLSGVLLHSKFLPEIIGKSQEELDRRQHFVDPDLYRSYHQDLTDAPVLHGPASCRFLDWGQLVGLELMGTGGWMDQELTD